jgi:hypothetical protein
VDLNAACDRLAVAVGTSLRETAVVATTLTVERWDAEQTTWVARKCQRDFPHVGEPVAAHFSHFRVKPYLVTVDEDCNLVTLAGWAALLGGIAGTSITNKFSATFGRVGAGTSTTTPTAADTKLGGDTGGGSTTSYYALVSGAPTIVTTSAPVTLTFSATFGTTVGNFAWNEFGTDNYTASGVTTQGLGGAVIFFNHGLSAQGTKLSGQTWTATETISAGNPSGAGTVN